ncbi:MAG: ATP-binding protein [Dehalococcoidales bacterium]
MARNFAVVFLPTLVLLVVIFGVRYYNNFNSEIDVIKAEAALNLDFDSGVIFHQLNAMLGDLTYLVTNNEIHEHLENLDDASKAELASEFLAFSTAEQMYDQIRLIDENGRELIRVNYNKGEPYIVPESELQNKESRYYFQDTIKLAPGQAYVSAFDLNIENEEIEYPLKPMIRAGAPVFDENGNARGIIVLNYLGGDLIGSLQNQPGAIYKVLLLNPEGYFLIGLNPEDEWGFMYEDGQDRTFGNTFPEAWQAINSHESDVFRNADGIFTFKKINLYIGDDEYSALKSVVSYKEYYWTLITYVSQDSIGAIRAGLISKYAVMFGGGVAVLGVAAGVAAYAMYRRRLADIALKRSEAKYRDMANLLPQIVFEVDDKDYLIFLNKAGFNVLKYNQDELERGLSFPDIILPGERERLQSDIQKLRAGQSVEAVEYSILDKDGSTFPVMAYFSAPAYGVRNAGFRGMVVDISELKRIDRMKTEFISVASHELKSPLASIYGFIKLLQDEKTGKINATQKEFLDIIETQTNLLNSLVGDLLDVARIESGKLTLTITEVNLAEIIKEAVAGVKPQAEEHHIKITTDMNFKEAAIMADRNRMMQIFFNLLSNAIKYNRDSGWVKITGRTVGDMAQIDVADNGLGIPAADIPSLFTKFFRAQNVYKSKAGGTGLGLSIARSIIELHGGKIWVESEEDKGSTFSFTLPRARKKDVPAAPAKSRGKGK